MKRSDVVVHQVQPEDIEAWLADVRACRTQPRQRMGYFAAFRLTLALLLTRAWRHRI